jgi:serine/threonine protein kinase
VKPREAVPSFDAEREHQVLFELGSGGMGTAHLARTTGIGGFEKLVVVKRLHAHLLNNAQAVTRFLDEARLAANVRHANVVSTHHVGRDEVGYFLLLDYIEGASLEELVDRAAVRGERLPIPVVLRIALDALSGLHATHNARDTRGRPLELLHRDVSLQNILIGRDGTARVADFGVAKSALGSSVTDEGYVLGKLLYLSPEYLKQEPVGPDIDVYALGVTLWIALSGKEPWPEATGAQLVTKVIERGLPRLDTAFDAPDRIVKLIAKAAHKERAHRFSTPRLMMDEIDSIARDTGWLASHAEVGECVERLCGTDLERRREFVSERLKDTGSMIPPAETAEQSEVIELVRPSAPAPALSAARPAAAPSRDLSTGPIEIPIRQTRLSAPLLVAGFLGLALVGAGVTYFVRSSGPDSTPTSSAAGAPPSAEVPEKKTEPVAPPATEEVPPVVSAAVEPVATKPKGAGARKPPVTERSAAPVVKAPPVTPPPATTPKNQDGINTKNPYEK